MTQTTKLPVTQATKLPVTQTKKKTVIATAALTSPLKGYTHRVSAIVRQLNAKIHSQTRKSKYTHVIYSEQSIKTQKDNTKFVGSYLVLTLVK